ncbi:secondary thiamine-phosphate synthase enzyme YjbQ [Pseudoalteromonas sp. BDTF-M6]|uniref:secondary thiamine-phosphate synthase enzyme YjbQ n=1 Tax=Pseudoalteromonas sp. BDTF-M6 TaxID=2796132 RepID=UPI001BAFD2AC|nr:secondary thiamine-phosphate synthase enzyme YjbQ [Pseudoalteromonas sp. BDTF-M6]MBS3797356.1 secondary thiamine-phosphate synthase enzyme YjbQ [Pseudoalteromonas sp. BDTF-M6]
MSWQQQQITLSAKARGFHLIDDELARLLPQIGQYQVGMVHLLLLHTSASLTINENADPTVRQDMEAHFNWAAPERQPFYRHTYEGDDDMPAHIKASTLGCELTLPIRDGRLVLGTWQGIYLGEHRDAGGKRRIIATFQGQLYP